jgi:carboxylesterase type B
MPVRERLDVRVAGENAAADIRLDPRRCEHQRRRVVVVTLNYRLGSFGFFSHSALTRESPHRARSMAIERPITGRTSRPLSN